MSINLSTANLHKSKIGIGNIRSLNRNINNRKNLHSVYKSPSHFDNTTKNFA